MLVELKISLFFGEHEVIKPTNDRSVSKIIKVDKPAKIEIDLLYFNFIKLLIVYSKKNKIKIWLQLNFSDITGLIQDKDT